MAREGVNSEKTPGPASTAGLAPRGSGVIPEESEENIYENAKKWVRELQAQLPRLDDLHLNLESYGEEWFDALELLARRVIAQKLNVPLDEVTIAEPYEYNVCNDDEAIHLLTPLGIVHVCFTYIEDVCFDWEVPCPLCGTPTPLIVLEAHIEEHEELERPPPPPFEV